MADILGDLERLEKLSLVSKVCTELENHLGVNDKDLAEFIIDLAEKNQSFEKFKRALLDASGEPFPDSFIANLLRIIQKMNPAMRQSTQAIGGGGGGGGGVSASTSAADLHRLTELNGPMSGSNYKPLDVEIKKALCPALALPNKVRRVSSSDEEGADGGKVKKEKRTTDENEDKRHKRDKDGERNTVKKEKEDRDESKSSSSSKPKKKSKKRSRSRSRSRSRNRRRR